MNLSASDPDAAEGRGDLAPPSPRAIDQSGERRSARIESLRAIGALGVIVSHMCLLSVAYQGTGYIGRLTFNTGYIGLYLFLALSGYLLFLPFARDQLGQGRAIDLRRYARNRALRILPLYYCAIGLLLVFHPFDVDRSQWWRFALFIQNYSHETSNRLNAPLWTLAVEVQFYILLPFLALLIAKIGGRSVRRSVAIMSAIAVASLALRAHELRLGDPNILGVLGKYALPSQLYAFIVGMLIAVLGIGWERNPPAWASRRLLGAGSAWIAAGIVVYLLVAYDRNMQEPTLAVAAFLIVGACVLPLRHGPLVQLLEWRPLATLGLATYSLYVWHGPIVVALSGIGPEFSEGILTSKPTGFKTQLAIGIPLCIAAAALSYLVIERPFLRRRRRWGSTATAPQTGAEAERAIAEPEAATAGPQPAR